jgi:hypothetical protein
MSVFIKPSVSLETNSGKGRRIGMMVVKNKGNCERGKGGKDMELYKRSPVEYSAIITLITLF